MSHSAQNWATVSPASELGDRLSHAANVIDAELITLLERQTDTFRGLDRRLGAVRLLPQTRAHVDQLTDLLTYSLPGGLRPRLAEAAAQAASLAGWQALDLGDVDQAWLLYETAKTAALDSNDASALAYVTAEQGYVLIDAGRPDLAADLIRSAHERAERGVPHVLRAWLWAAEAEAAAAGRDEAAARRAMDAAARELAISGGDRLPYVFLNDVHLARWRGHCLARLGSAEAVDDLSHALGDLDQTFTRAAAGLHCDLALAYSQRGEHDAARAEARAAQQLADQTASARQRRRISQLLASGEDDGR
jgi:hypothetical protein